MQEFPPSLVHNYYWEPRTEGNFTLDSCYHYDSFMFVCVMGVETAVRIRMAVGVTQIMLGVMCL